MRVSMSHPTPDWLSPGRSSRYCLSMRHSLALAAFVASLTTVSACDDNSTTPDAAATPDARPGADGGPTATADAPPSTADAPTARDAPAATADAPDLPDAGPTFSLTIENFDGWCDITANGSPFTANNIPMASASKSFPQNSVVELHAGPNGDFVWGYWTGTDHVVDGKDPNQSTTLTLSADTTIMVCCPISSGTTCTF
jgi:hypothetical protein